MTDKKDNQAKFLTLREEYPFITYQKFDIQVLENKTRVTYYFNLSDKLTFTPYFEFDNLSEKDLSEHQWQNLLFNIGLIELISYWKATCSPQIIIEPFALSPTQVDWWKKLYFWGLGEFFYLNQIQTTQETFVDIVNAKESKHISIPKEASKNTLDPEKYMVPLGGGKDSAVTLELLTKNKLATTVFLLNSRPTPLKVAEIANVEHVYSIRRVLDKQLLALNAQGYLNGHTPFSALLAFYSVFVAEILDIEHIVLSNEASANEATIPNTKINHQYSKSLEFEQDFRAYVEKFLNTKANYFSLLRPINEIQIASLLSKFPKYWDTFKSCNVGSKKDVWCCDCSKCLFTYTMLSPFIPQERLISFFGKNLFENKNLLPTFEQLIGVADEKPFECIGTIDEVNLAVQMSIQKMGGEKLPALLEYYDSLAIDLHDESLMTVFESIHCIPENLEKILINELKNS